MKDIKIAKHILGETRKEAFAKLLKGVQNNRCVILSGDICSGKTSFINILQHEYDYEIITLENQKDMPNEKIKDFIENLLFQKSASAMFGIEWHQVLVIDDYDYYNLFIDNLDSLVSGIIASSVKKDGTSRLHMPFIYVVNNHHKYSINKFRARCDIVTCEQPSPSLLEVFIVDYLETLYNKYYINVLVKVGKIEEYMKDCCYEIGSVIKNMYLLNTILDRITDNKTVCTNAAVKDQLNEFNSGRIYRNWLKGLSIDNQLELVYSDKMICLKELSDHVSNYVVYSLLENMSEEIYINRMMTKNNDYLSYIISTNFKFCKSIHNTDDIFTRSRVYSFYKLKNYRRKTRQAIKFNGSNTLSRNMQLTNTRKKQIQILQNNILYRDEKYKHKQKQIIDMSNYVFVLESLDKLSDIDSEYIKDDYLTDAVDVYSELYSKVS